MIVTARRMLTPGLGAVALDTAEIARQRASTSDTASLLKIIPGVATYGAGGVSSLPVIRGLADDRLRTQVDGVDIAAACPNHMNPPLSYIDPTAVAGVDLYAGVTPVSVGGDSIGGSINRALAGAEIQSRSWLRHTAAACGGPAPGPGAWA